MAIICHCLGVRDRTIAKAVHRGATTLADVQEQCGAGTQCGGCHLAVGDLIDHHGHGARRLPRVVAHAG